LQTEESTLPIRESGKTRGRVNGAGTPNARLFSFFSGAGFLDLGFEAVGFEIVLVNEIYRPFLVSYTKSRERMGLPKPLYGYEACDVRDLLVGAKRTALGKKVRDAKRDGHLVGFIGGPPCPDFSIAGHNKGGDGDNGRLSASYMELVCQQKPSFFVFENVKGLWQTKRHREFYCDLRQQAWDAGYVTDERMINALEYGVPQDRDRVILVGFQEGLVPQHMRRDKGHLFDHTAFPWRDYVSYNLDVTKNLPWPTQTPFGANSVLPAPPGVPIELTVQHWFSANAVSIHPNANDVFLPRQGLARFISIPEGDTSRKSYKRLHRWRYSPTACYGHNEVHLHPYEPRRISVAEALALQSLPASYVLPAELSLTDKFKTVGNGVPYLAARGIALTIQEMIRRLT